MRTCTACGATHETRYSRCKPCYNEYMRTYMKDRYHRIYQDAKEQLGNQCTDCGAKENLEFDHIDRSQKTGDLADLWSYSLARFHEELKKCTLRCISCHRRRTKIQLSNPHGGGLTGRRGCNCQPCRQRRREYYLERKTQVR